MEDQGDGQSLGHNKGTMAVQGGSAEESTMKSCDANASKLNSDLPQQYSSISRSDSSDSFDSFVSSLSGEESRVDDGLHGGQFLDGRNSLQEVDNQDFEMSSPALSRYRIDRVNPIAPMCSSSTTSSRDSNEFFTLQGSHGNSLPPVKTNRSNKNIDALQRLSLSLKPMKSYIRRSQNILPPLSLGNRNSEDKKSSDSGIARPQSVSRDVSLSSMEITPTFMSPMSLASSPHLNAGPRESSISARSFISRPRPLHQRNVSNASTVFSGSESSAFPIVGYLSDEHSRSILQKGSEDNSAQQSSEEERKKKSWAAKEMKHFKKKFSSKRLGGGLNKNVQLHRSKGYLM